MSEIEIVVFIGVVFVAILAFWLGYMAGNEAAHYDRDKEDQLFK
jgi:hypothetical protein